MAKYKVLKPFRDIKTGEKYMENQEVEMTVKRAEEAIQNLKKWGGKFLERIDDKPPEGEVAEESEKPTEKEE